MKGEPIHCAFCECEGSACLDKSQHYELIGRLSDDGRELTEVTLHALVE